MLSKLRIFLVCMIALYTPAALRAQKTIHVPTDQSTIQAGINAANNGDTVLVAPGTYYENIQFNGKAITVTSSGGAANTIIDGGAIPGLAVVGFGNNETRSSVLSNLTIRNGGPVTFDSNFTPDAGGGIYISASSPTILDNIITANQCNGVDVYDGAALIQGNTISATTFAEDAYCSFQPVAVVLEGNLPSSALLNSVIGNTIENNVSPYGDSQAAIFIWVSDGNIIVGNTIRNNISSQGAVQMYNSESIIFSQNLVYGNYVSDNLDGGGGAGGLYLAIPDGGPPYYGVIANNTFANNTTSEGIGGASDVYIDGDVSTFSFVNNILYGTGSYPLLVCNGAYAYLSPGPMLVENNDVYNPSGPSYDSSCANGAGSAGNIAVDPLFNDAASSDFHVTSGSPAIDTGNNQALAMLMPYNVGLTTDLDGNPRLQAVKSATCIIDMGTYEYPGSGSACSIAETITSSLISSIFGQNVTFTAQLFSTSGVPTGDIQFADGLTILGAQPISGTGASTISTAQLTVGSHSITATYQPTGVFSATSASLTQVVNGYASTTNITCSAMPIDIGSTTLLSILVTSTYGTPTGSVTFTDNATAIGQSTLANGAATFPYNAIATGTHTIVATYVPTGNFAASSGSCSLTVNGLPTTTTVAVSPNPSTYGQPVVFSTHVAPVTPNQLVPTGKVRFTFCRGATSDVVLDVNGNGSFTTPTGVEIADPVSSCVFTGQYSGDNTFSPSTSATATYVVGPSPSTTTIVSALPNPAYVAQPVTFTIQITGTPSPTADPITGKPIPSGSLQFTGIVQLFDGSLPIASAPAITQGSNPSNGLALFTLTTLAAGTHTISAVYSDDPNLGGSTSTAVAEVIVAPPPANFTLTGPSTITAQTGSTGTGTLTLTSINNFSSPVALTCSLPLPTTYACTLSPAGVTLAANSSGASTITLAPTSNQAVVNRLSHRTPSGSRVVLASLLPLSLLTFVGLARRRRGGSRVRRLLSLTVLAILAGSTTACGPDVFYASTPPGDYPLTIVATGTALGIDTPITHTLNVTLDLTP